MDSGQSWTLDGDIAQLTPVAAKAMGVSRVGANMSATNCAIDIFCGRDGAGSIN